MTSGANPVNRALNLNNPVYPQSASRAQPYSAASPPVTQSAKPAQAGGDQFSSLASLREIPTAWSPESSEVADKAVFTQQAERSAQPDNPLNIANPRLAEVVYGKTNFASTLSPERKRELQEAAGFNPDPVKSDKNFFATALASKANGESSGFHVGLGARFHFAESAAADHTNS